MFFETQRNPILTITVALLVIVGLAMRQPQARAISPGFGAEEQLIVFTQTADVHFRTTCLPELRTWAAEQGLHLEELDAVAGMPGELTATPAIVFQNSRGRSVYAQRYAELNTIQNFVRSSRIRPQAAIPFCAEQVLQCTRGRSRINVPLKLTALSGSLPMEWDSADFARRALAAVDTGMETFEQRDTACLKRTDRAFYADLHPYRSESGELFLSLELYAMFNCIRPVWKTEGEPLRGDFSQFESLFQQAGKRFAQMIDEQLHHSTIGDAWTPLAAEVPVVSWEDLGLGLPAGTKPVTKLPTDISLGGRWTVRGAAIPGVPILSFRFLAPLERYAGELSDFGGTMELTKAGELLSGEFVVATRSLTMGMQELDDKVKRKYIYARRYPKASFRFVLDEALPLKAGHLNRFAVPGTFTMMKKEVPLTVQAELSPQPNAVGEAAVYAHVSFELNITDQFGIKGPDGPELASKTLDFDLNFLLEQN